MKNFLNEGNQIRNVISSSGSGTVINYGSGSDFLTSYGSDSGSGSTSQKVTVTVPVPVPVPQRCQKNIHIVFPSISSVFRHFDQTRILMSFSRVILCRIYVYL
jgi:hypothetical protein